ncbi:type II secretion system protein GspL [Sphingomonas colocasiae]|uniref:General secretion pathway protein GspL n=1 Tax=Sphingomonas colocasiae TaxID=1848973 RepID=A0ABS7PNZ1_9SPHN|nr:type II secretion system protein GspL [Sphingomonas colocasiae]MBY8823027.1 general secretion pathway protein GspL [Sphingomonas colocasiae]
MSALRLLFLSADPMAPVAWRLLEDGRESAAGDDLVACPPYAGEVRVVAIAPAAATMVNWAELPALAPAQARAAARLLAAENSVVPLDTLHVAVGEPDDLGDRALVTVDRALLTSWIAQLQALGHDPDAILPAALLLPRPDEGYVRGTVAGQALVRGRGSGFLDEPGLSGLILADAPVVTLAPDEAEAALLAGVERAEVDLRAGGFARRKPWQLDWGLIRRLAWLGAGILIATLLIHMVLILKYSTAADAIELRTRAVAQSALPGGSGDANALFALDERLAAARGGGAGFSTTAASIYAAVRAVPNIELTAFDFAVDGSLRITIAAATVEDITAFQRQLERYGFDGTATQPRVEAGRQMVEMTVRLP